MWEQFIKCFNKGGKAKGCNAVELVDLYKRVPPNQRKQFKEFAKKNEEYKERLRKYPPDLPAIDWAYYKQNVRQDMVSWVLDFEKKYDKLDSIFTNRHSLFDHSKYFGEVTAQTEEVKKEVKKFKAESNKRIEVLEEKMEHLKCMKPYTEMTMEEFCLAHPQEAPDFINRPTFWPHTPEEQKPGPSEDVAHEEAPKEPDGSGKSASKDDKSDPKKTPPPKTPPAGSAPAAGDKPKAPAEVKKDAAKDTKDKTKDTTDKSKDTTDKSKDPCEAEKKEKLADGKVKVQQNTESQAVETAAQFATKTIDFAKDLAAKAVTMCKSLWQKVGEKRKEVGKKESDQKATTLASSTAVKPTPVDDDDIHRRETAYNICNKTIIRGEDTARADVKPQHVDLDIEAGPEQDEDKPPKRGDKEGKVCKSEHEDAEEEECQLAKKSCPEEEKKSLCMEDIKKDLGECEQQEEDPCVHWRKITEKKSTEKPQSCEPTDFNKLDITYSSTDPKSLLPVNQLPYDAQTIGNILPKKETEKPPTISEHLKDSVDPKQAQQLVIADPINPVTLNVQAPQIVNEPKAEQTEENIPQGTCSAVQMKSEEDTDNMQANQDKNEPVQGVASTTICLSDAQPVITSFKNDQPESGQDKPNKINPEDVAKLVFDMATSAASLLSEAKKTIEMARLEKGDGIVAAYEHAEQKVTLALAQAYKALSAAKDAGLVDPTAIALIEKHALLAKLLAHRAITMKKEIAKLLDDLKRNN
ncbi:eukaryotic translation initiation factor 5B [Drosophila virilis]|uniref:Uncharacterized protein n=1 Tax=Drosophila virilis TaxID=7244 RepID=B4LME8_DROVI|nr:titin [Drosophila virilis]EDW62043.2 uncharacterized protein Dvir_GJ19972 [Drosophila virilis]